MLINTTKITDLVLWKEEIWLNVNDLEERKERKFSI